MTHKKFLHESGVKIYVIMRLSTGAALTVVHSPSVCLSVLHVPVIFLKQESRGDL